MCTLLTLGRRWRASWGTRQTWLVQILLDNADFQKENGKDKQVQCKMRKKMFVINLRWQDFSGEEKKSNPIRYFQIAFPFSF